MRDKMGKKGGLVAGKGGCLRMEEAGGMGNMAC